jgi:hypothetical protein
MALVAETHLGRTIVTLKIKLKQIKISETSIRHTKGYSFEKRKKKI